MFTLSKKQRRKLNKKLLRRIAMAVRIQQNKYKDEFNSKHTLLKYYGKEIESIKHKLRISKYCL